MWRVDQQCERGGEELALARFMPYEIAAADSETVGVARAWFASREEAGRCAADLGASVQEEPEDNWNAEWQQSQWRAEAVGQRLWLTPPWHSKPAPEGRIRLEMHPGTLFGNGDHPTTRLCLEALERHVTPASIVADIGCGSGLIPQAARLLGAKFAFGCDLDARAARAAGIAFQGSINSLTRQTISIAIANIQVGALIELLPDIRRVLLPGGVAILSGILEDQVGMLPLRASRIETRDGWACLEL